MQCEWLMDNYTMLPESREQVIMIIVWLYADGVSICKGWRSVKTLHSDEIEMNRKAIDKSRPIVFILLPRNSVSLQTCEQEAQHVENCKWCMGDLGLCNPSAWCQPGLVPYIAPGTCPIVIWSPGHIAIREKEESPEWPAWHMMSSIRLWHFLHIQVTAVLRRTSSRQWSVHLVAYNQQEGSWYASERRRCASGFQERRQNRNNIQKSPYRSHLPGLIQYLRR